MNFEENAVLRFFREKISAHKILSGVVGIIVFVILATAESMISDEVSQLSLKDRILGFLGDNGAAIVFVSALGLAGLIIAYLLYQQRVLTNQIVKLSLRDSENEKEGHPEKFARFEDIATKGVTVGYIDFEPTLYHGQGGADPTGPGFDLLKNILGNKMQIAHRPTNWDSLVEHLESGICDIIATPLYEIRSREREVAFTSPVFYADIGVFVKKPFEFIDMESQQKAPFEFDALLSLFEKISRREELCSRFWEGELNGKLCRKYLSDIRLEKMDISQSLTTDNLLSHLSEPSEDFDLIFCERAIGEAHKDYNVKFQNLLRPGQLLFPVCFALRQSEDTLRKFINLKLLNLESEGDDKVQDLLKSSLLKTPWATRVDATKIDQYFNRGNLEIFQDEAGEGQQVPKSNVIDLDPRN